MYWIVDSPDNWGEAYDDIPCATLEEARKDLATIAQQYQSWGCVCTPSEDGMAVHISFGENDEQRWISIEQPKFVRLVNRTPHEITVGGITLPAAQNPLRCAAGREQVDELKLQDGTTIPVNRTVFKGDPDGAPFPEVGVVYVVSRVAAEKYAHRCDLLVVDETYRDEQGKIIGARALARV